jgi:aspartate/methionine/tyrosine aminotransferase
MKEYDFTYGDPIVVRQALTETLGRTVTPHQSYQDMAYPLHEGSHKLIEQMKVLAERQSGHKPKHLIVTCGASGAVNAALFALKTGKTDWVVTSKRCYPRFPQIIGLTDMVMIDKNKKQELLTSGLKESNFLSLTDSPSNPEGLVSPFEDVDIWDAAYASQIYTSGGHTPKSYRVMCGSLSKTLGLAGLRLGWCSTNDDEVYKKLYQYVDATYVGLSGTSMAIAEEVLDVLYLDQFEAKAQNYLNNNREEMQKVLDRFDQGDVPTRGMFTILQLGKIERKALEKAGIKWLPGSFWGEDDSWARLSLGQTRELTREAVKTMLK